MVVGRRGSLERRAYDGGGRGEVRRLFLRCTDIEVGRGEAAEHRLGTADFGVGEDEVEVDWKCRLVVAVRKSGGGGVVPSQIPEGFLRARAGVELEVRGRPCALI